MFFGIGTMNTSRNIRLALGVSVLLGAFGFLLVGGMQSSTLRAIPVSELEATPASTQAHLGQRLRVVGFVGQEPVRRVPDAVNTDAGAVGGTGSTQHFLVHDEEKTIAVEYRDALPETFKAGSPVQVDGVYYAPGKLRADRVLTKCPSKYQAEEVEKATNERSAARPEAVQVSVQSSN